MDGVDDQVVDGDVEYSMVLSASSVDPNYAGLAPVEFALGNVDDDSATLTVSAANTSLVEGTGGANALVDLRVELSGAVEGVDNPEPIRVVFEEPAFFGKDAVVRKCFLDAFDNHFVYELIVLCGRIFSGAPLTCQCRAFSKVAHEHIAGSCCRPADKIYHQKRLLWQRVRIISCSL